LYFFGLIVSGLAPRPSTSWLAGIYEMKIQVEIIHPPVTFQKKKRKVRLFYRNGQPGPITPINNKL